MQSSEAGRQVKVIEEFDQYESEMQTGSNRLVTIAAKNY